MEIHEITHILSTTLSLIININVDIILYYNPTIIPSFYATSYFTHRCCTCPAFFVRTHTHTHTHTKYIQQTCTFCIQFPIYIMSVKMVAQTNGFDWMRYRFRVTERIIMISIINHTRNICILMFMRVRSMNSNRTHTHILRQLFHAICALLASSAFNTNECHIYTPLLPLPAQTPKHTHPIVSRNLFLSIFIPICVVQPANTKCNDKWARALCLFLFNRRYSQCFRSFGFGIVHRCHDSAVPVCV